MGQKGRPGKGQDFYQILQVGQGPESRLKYQIMKPIKRRIAMYFRQAVQGLGRLFTGARAGTKTGF
jgi:hypothetical protein